MRIAWIVILLLITGCAAIKPTPISRPNLATVETDFPEYEKGLGFSGDKTIAHIRKVLIAYEVTWNQTVQQQRDNLYYANQLSFIGAIAAAVAGIRQSEEGLLIAGGAVAGSGIYSSHFNFAVQIANYQKAAAAMACIRNAIDDVPEPILQTFVHKAAAKKGAATSEELAKISDIPDAAVRAIEDVVSKLDEAQAAVVLAVPDAASMREAFLQYSKEAGKTPSTGTKTVANTFFTNGVQDDLLKKVLLIPDSIATCNASFGRK